jgi:histidinol dehydrogenase
MGPRVAADLPRPKATAELPVEAVRAIISEVRSRGDAALFELTAKFDGIQLDSLVIDQAEMRAALDRIPAQLRGALEASDAAIDDYHRHLVTELPEYRRGSLTVRELRRPVRRAGLYVPGGKARYPSSVLMNAVPARVAGVRDLVLCTPPGPDGRIDDPTLAACAIAGITEAYAVGGAQAIAAMAYGTSTVAPVDVIVGPGNVFVSVAKREVAGAVGVPSAFAGPSEVVVIADETTPVTWAAIDVVVQAEHGPDGLAWLICWSEEVAHRVAAEVSRLVEESPRRQAIESTLAEGGYAVVVDGPEEAMAVANEIAPEHLEIMTSDPEPLLELVQNAGAVFTGPYSPASVGDYLAGPSHVLPTYGSARYSEALTVDDFVKRVHVVTLDRPALDEVGPHVIAIADAEGLDAHAGSVRVRIGS